MSRNEYFGDIRDAIQEIADHWSLTTYRKIRDGWLEDGPDGVVVELEDGGLQIIVAYHHGDKELSDLDDPVIARYIFRRKTAADE